MTEYQFTTEPNVFIRDIRKLALKLSSRENNCPNYNSVRLLCYDELYI
jgi:hypothetical protein